MTATFTPRPASLDRFLASALPTTNPEVVAALSSRQISEMSRDALLQAISTVPPPFLTDEQLGRLRYSDRPTLERMAHLARHCVRNRQDEAAVS